MLHHVVGWKMIGFRRGLVLRVNFGKLFKIPETFRLTQLIDHCIIGRL